LPHQPLGACEIALLSRDDGSVDVCGSAGTATLAIIAAQQGDLEAPSG